jgi:HlyD family secretion protein
MRPRLILIALGGLGLAVVAAFGIHAQGETPQSGYRLAALSRGPLVSSITASGTFRPTALVAVTGAAPGQLRELAADINQEVKAGDVLARLDDAVAKAHVASAQAELAVAQGAVEVARGQLERAKSGVANAEAVRTGAAADVDHANEGVAAADRDLRRTQKLAGTGDAAKVEIERAQAALDQAQSGVVSAKARVAAAVAGVAAANGDVRVAEAQLTNAQAGVNARQAALNEIQLELDHTVIRAPIDGVVLDREAAVGQLVGAGGAEHPLFTVASDLRSLLLHASVDEADIGRIERGQQASFTVDAYPNETFQGRVETIKRAPQTIQNVVTYDVIIVADNPDLRLLPGMTANARIVVAQEDDALRVPSAALRFVPPAKGGRATGDTVWTVDDKGKVRPHKVKPGQSDGTLTALLESDLKQGQEVVVGIAPPAETTRSALSF